MKSLWRGENWRQGKTKRRSKTVGDLWVCGELVLIGRESMKVHHEKPEVVSAQVSWEIGICSSWYCDGNKRNKIKETTFQNQCNYLRELHFTWLGWGGIVFHAGYISCGSDSVGWGWWHHQHMTICNKYRLLGFTPSVLNQDFLSWNPVLRVLTNPPGDFDANQSLRITEMHF